VTETADSTESVAAAAAARPFTAVYDPRLANDDLIPLEMQTWSSYNILAFWMSDVHSVGGYVTAGSLFALGLSSW
jgi:NCS1 family nucleobase:cation symporter-1